MLRACILYDWCQRSARQVKHYSHHALGALSAMTKAGLNVRFVREAAKQPAQSAAEPVKLLAHSATGKA